MANATTGTVALTLEFEAKSASAFNSAVEAVQEASAAFAAALTDAGIRGVTVLASDVLVGQTFSVVADESVPEEGDEPTAAVDDDGEEEAEEETPAPTPKRRGRPPGSGKKAAPAAESDTPKRRGRPPGSGKKAAAAPAASDTPKRRGRPPGVKNGEGRAAKAKAAAARGAKKRR